jgi:hypothetical protein
MRYFQQDVLLADHQCMITGDAPPTQMRQMAGLITEE